MGYRGKGPKEKVEDEELIWIRIFMGMTGNKELMWIPAFAGMTTDWIPAFTGMTIDGFAAFGGVTNDGIIACAGMRLKSGMRQSGREKEVRRNARWKDRAFLIFRHDDQVPPDDHVSHDDQVSI